MCDSRSVVTRVYVVISLSLSLLRSVSLLTPFVPQQAVVGPLEPYPDEASVRRNHAAAKFRLSLWPDASGVLPKLTGLLFNDAMLCTSSDCE